MAGSKVRRQRRGPPNGINRRLYRRRSIYRSIYLIEFIPSWFHTAPPRGSGRIEDACGESPAAPLVKVLRSAYILFEHYSHESIPERCYGFLERFWGLLGGVGGIWGGLGGLLGWSSGVFGRSWRGLGGVLGGLGTLLGRHIERCDFRSIF